MTRRHNPFPGITSVTDRHGKRRYRFRMKGKPSLYIPGEYGSVEFRAAYEAAMASRPVKSQSRVHAQGSFDWLCERYLVTPEFQKIGPVYTRNLSLQIDRFRREYGACMIADLRPDHVETIIGKKADTPAAANEVLKLIRRLCRYAVKRGWLAKDPTTGVKTYAMNPDGYYTWTEADILQFEAHHGIQSRAVLALRLILNTGARRANLVRLGWQSIDWQAKDGPQISFRPVKAGEMVTLPVLPELADVLESVPRDQMLFICTGQGGPYKPESFGNWFRDQCAAAGLSKCSAHGLRKAGATRLANAGANEYEVMAFLGHKTPDEARTYTQKFNRSQAGASGMAKVANASNPIIRLDKVNSNPLK